MEIYGKALARYRGRGRLFLRGEPPFPCQVNVAQRSDGVILVECQVMGARVLMINPDRAEAKCVTLKSDVGCVSASRLFGPNHYGVRFRGRGTGRTHAVKLVYYANQVDVSYAPCWAPAAHARFGVLNFEYLGNTWQKVGDRTVLGALSARLPPGEILFEWVNGYEETIKRLKAVGGVDVTCHVSMSLDSGASLSRVTKEMEDLCALLSFARGTKINWAYFETVSEAGVKLHTRHVSRVTKRFTPLPLIDPREPDDLLSLLSCFHRFREAEEAHSLKRVVDHYTDAKADQAFLEARGMLAAILVDFLLGRYRTRANRHSIRKDFNGTRVQRALRKGLKELLGSAFSDITDDEEEQFLENLQSLNRPAFRQVLREFADSLGVRTSEEEIKRITKIRNSLVHNASFLHDTENHTQYYHLINFLDRILLSILGYAGYYIDCTTSPWKRVQI